MPTMATSSALSKVRQYCHGFLQAFDADKTTECFKELGLDVPPEMDKDLLKKVEQNSLTKAALAAWYESRIDLLEGACILAHQPCAPDKKHCIS
jgi:hypothetical protein